MPVVGAGQNSHHPLSGAGQLVADYFLEVIPRLLGIHHAFYELDWIGGVRGVSQLGHLTAWPAYYALCAANRRGCRTFRVTPAGRLPVW